MQLLEIRIAQHQAVIGIPQHEGLRDGLDGVAQAHVGGHRLFDQVLLLGDVDRDADQMQARLARLVHQLATGAQPHPVAVGVAHAESVIDGGGVGFGEFGGEIVEQQVVGVGQRAHVVERQQVVFGLQPENVEHRLRPVDAPAPEVPIPQAAAAAVERGIDAAADRLIDHVCFARARRLPVEGKAEDEHDEPGGGGQRDGQRGERTPAGERRAARLHDRDLAERRGEPAHGGERLGLIGQGDFQNAGVGAERGQQFASTPGCRPRAGR